MFHRAFFVLLAWASTSIVFANQSEILQEPIDKSIFSPDYAESGKEPMIFYGAPSKSIVGPIVPAGGQPRGTLSGRIVFAECGHGWTWDGSMGRWRLLRGVGQEMNEDYGNIDQLNMFATYCFNAGATVVAFRPLGHQTNLVILDNDSPNVSFAGSWANSTATSTYWGSAGDVAYRYSSVASTETATATYTPNIPKADFYPVYTWVRHGSDRVDQLYRIRHTGGESQVRVPHYMVGNGWVYLGEYYFNAGSNAPLGSVVISNLRSTTNGSVIIADAIRFGNGMGRTDRGGGVSAYPSEDESSRYGVLNMVGYGQSTSLYEGSGDDESDGWSAPPKMAAEMNREASGNAFKRIYLGFHSNASSGSARGTVGLINSGNQTPNQADWAATVSDTINNDLIVLGAPPLEFAWADRGGTYSGGYGEISNGYLDSEMDATIVEVAFHDNASDAKLLRSALARAAIAKAAYHSVVKFMNKHDALPISYLPEPPVNVRVQAGTNASITVSWNASITSGGSGVPTNYIVYLSTNGYGFGNPISVGNVLTYTYTNLASNIDYYFRVAASNVGGESLPSETVGCRASSANGTPRVLFVNAFWRYDRMLNPRQNVTPGSWDIPGLTGDIERVLPRMVNSFDYVVQHGKSLAANGWAFDSCSKQAVTGNQVRPTNYAVVIWALGQQSSKFNSGDRIFVSGEQSAISSYLAGKGSLFVSGSDVGYELDRASGPTTADRNFLRNQLHCTFGNDTNGGSYGFVGTTGGIFAGNASGAIDNNNKGIYPVQAPDELVAYGTGASAAITYSSGGLKTAAVQYDGSAGGGRTVVFGFPFETITSATVRNAYMADVLNYLTLPAIIAQPQPITLQPGTNTSLSVDARGAQPLAYQWRLNGTNISGAAASNYSIANASPADLGTYSVVVSNSLGFVVSSNAAVTMVIDPPAITAHPQDLALRAGESATFTVDATGYFLSYQWLFNGTNIAGANSSSLVLSQVQVGQAGAYSAIVSNVAGAVTSSNAVLQVRSSVQFAPLLLSPAGVEVTFTGDSNDGLRIECSSNLIDWLPMTNVIETNGNLRVIDSGIDQQKFYRGFAVPLP